MQRSDIHESVFNGIRNSYRDYNALTKFEDRDFICTSRRARRFQNYNKIREACRTRVLELANTGEVKRIEKL